MKSINPLYQPNEECLVCYVQFTSTQFYSAVFFRAENYCPRILKTKFGLGQSLTVRSTFKIRKVFDKRYKSTRILRFQRT